jgi:hypothetical protein
MLAMVPFEGTISVEFMLKRHLLDTAINQVQIPEAKKRREIPCQKCRL